ncbi:MAG TPA: esterase-like activity of phytase family protein, partial [Polyangiaceae bacterium]|nr:esterase-like activity of phytase family protein [Polyangiaceae bacterium]
VYDSGDAAELLAVRAGAYPDGRSDAKGVEFEGCALAVFGATESSPGTEYGFLLGERNATLTVLDMASPTAPVPVQILGAPMRPEGVTTIPARGLVVVSGEGDEVGGGLWIYAAKQHTGQPSYGDDVYHAISDGTPFGALGALTWEPGGRIVATPDNAFDRQRIWWFEPDHLTQRVKLTRELLLSDAAGAPLTGYDPEGIALNPAGGFVIASEGIAGNGGSTTCVGSAESNRILFVDAAGKLDPAYGVDGIVDLPCGTETNALDWTTVRANGFEGLAAIDSTPAAAGGVKIYVAMQRALTNEGQNTRIGEYDVDSGEWSFYFYTLDANPGGDAGNTFLSELLHVRDDLFAVIERDQGFAGAAANKTIRTFRLASGAANNPLNPLNKLTVANLLTHPFRFDQEKLEGLALGAGDLWISNDNDGGEAINFLVKLDPTVLGD